MRYLTVEEVLALHSRIIASSGGSLGLREPNALERRGSATSDDVRRGRSIYDRRKKGRRSGPFADLKPSFHRRKQVMLLLNGYEIVASVDQQEEVIIAVASGTMSRDEFASWVEQRVTQNPRAAT
jgi:death-on-curing protein